MTISRFEIRAATRQRPMKTTHRRVTKYQGFRARFTQSTIGFDGRTPKDRKLLTRREGLSTSE
jgi:hypothetical protein